MLIESSLPVDTIFTMLTKTRINAISIKYDSMKFMIQGEPLLGSKRDSGKNNIF